MDDRFQSLAEEIESLLPDGTKCAYRDQPYGGLSLFILKDGTELYSVGFDLDEVEDFTDERIVQSVLAQFRKRARA